MPFLDALVNADPLEDRVHLDRLALLRHDDHDRAALDPHTTSEQRQKTDAEDSDETVYRMDEVRTRRVVGDHSTLWWPNKPSSPARRAQRRRVRSRGKPHRCLTRAASGAAWVWPALRGVGRVIRG